MGISFLEGDFGVAHHLRILSRAAELRVVMEGRDF